MTPLLLAALAALPCVYWTQGIESRPALDGAGVKRICVAPELVDVWRAAGFSVSPIAPADLTSRAALPVPGITPRAGLASPTRSPWVVASGWQFARKPKAAFVYELPTGKAALAAAEAFAYGADAVLKIDPADLGAAGAMLRFLEGVPASDLPALADFAVVDDGSPVTGEVLNLLARRNLLFQIVQAPVGAVPRQYRDRVRRLPAGGGRRSERVCPEECGGSSPTSSGRCASTGARSSSAGSPATAGRSGCISSTTAGATSKACASGCAVTTARARPLVAGARTSAARGFCPSPAGPLSSRAANRDRMR